MSVKKPLFLVHRWIGLVVALQLLAWSVGGFVFTILDLDDVHGDLDRSLPPRVAIAVAEVATTPAQAIEAAAKEGVDAKDVSGVELRRRIDGPVYVVNLAGKGKHVVVDARTGLLAPTISEELARTIALNDFKHDARVESVELLKGEPPGEYRGGSMPVYRVILEHPKHPHLYISPTTGDVLKRRNENWRWFDLFWMLHIMDYRERNNFNHWLLTGASVLAILTSVSGLALWWYRLPCRKRRPSV